MKIIIFFVSLLCMNYHDITILQPGREHKMPTTPYGVQFISDSDPTVLLVSCKYIHFPFSGCYTLYELNFIAPFNVFLEAKFLCYSVCPSSLTIKIDFHVNVKSLYQLKTFNCLNFLIAISVCHVLRTKLQYDSLHAGM